MPRPSQNALRAGTFSQPNNLTQKTLSTHSNVSLFGTQDEELKEHEEKALRAKEEEDR